MYLQQGKAGNRWAIGCIWPQKSEMIFRSPNIHWLQRLQCRRNSLYVGPQWRQNTFNERRHRIQGFGWCEWRSRYNYDDNAQRGLKETSGYPVYDFSKWAVFLIQGVPEKVSCVFFIGADLRVGWKCRVFVECFGEKREIKRLLDGQKRILTFKDAYGHMLIDYSRYSLHSTKTSLQFWPKKLTSAK